MQEQLFAFISKYIVFTEEEKKFILDLGLFHAFKKGTVLLKEGEYTVNSYFVVEGCLRSYYIIDGEERTTDFYTEMEGLTPACVSNKRPSEHFISCVEDCLLLVSNPAAEQAGFEKFPRFESLCRLFSEEQLAKSQEDFAYFKNASPEERYLQLLEKKPALVKRVPQHQLASYLGIKPESLSRIRRRITGKEK